MQQEQCNSSSGGKNTHLQQSDPSSCEAQQLTASLLPKSEVLSALQDLTLEYSTLSPDQVRARLNMLIQKEKQAENQRSQFLQQRLDEKAKEQFQTLKKDFVMETERFEKILKDRAQSIIKSLQVKHLDRLINLVSFLRKIESSIDEEEFQGIDQVANEINSLIVRVEGQMGELSHDETTNLGALSNTPAGVQYQLMMQQKQAHEFGKQFGAAAGKSLQGMSNDQINYFASNEELQKRVGMTPFNPGLRERVFSMQQTSQGVTQNGSTGFHQVVPLQYVGVSCGGITSGDVLSNYVPRNFQMIGNNPVNLMSADGQSIQRNDLQMFPHQIPRSNTATENPNQVIQSEAKSSVNKKPRFVYELPQDFPFNDLPIQKFSSNGDLTGEMQPSSNDQFPSGQSASNHDVNPEDVLRTFTNSLHSGHTLGAIHSSLTYYKEALQSKEWSNLSPSNAYQNYMFRKNLVGEIQKLAKEIQKIPTEEAKLLADELSRSKLSQGGSRKRVFSSNQQNLGVNGSNVNGSGSGSGGQVSGSGQPGIRTGTGYIGHQSSNLTDLNQKSIIAAQREAEAAAVRQEAKRIVDDSATRLEPVVRGYTDAPLSHHMMHPQANPPIIERRAHPRQQQFIAYRQLEQEDYQYGTVTWSRSGPIQDQARAGSATGSGTIRHPDHRPTRSGDLRSQRDSAVLYYPTTVSRGDHSKTPLEINFPITNNPSLEEDINTFEQNRSKSSLNQNPNKHRRHRSVINHYSIKDNNRDVNAASHIRRGSNLPLKNSTLNGEQLSNVLPGFGTNGTKTIQSYRQKSYECVEGLTDSIVITGGPHATQQPYHSSIQPSSKPQNPAKTKDNQKNSLRATNMAQSSREHPFQKTVTFPLHSNNKEWFTQNNSASQALKEDGVSAAKSTSGQPRQSQQQKKDQTAVVFQKTMIVSRQSTQLQKIGGSSNIGEQPEGCCEEGQHDATLVDNRHQNSVHAQIQQIKKRAVNNHSGCEVVQGKSSLGGRLISEERASPAPLSSGGGNRNGKKQTSLSRRFVILKKDSVQMGGSVQQTSQTQNPNTSIQSQVTQQNLGGIDEEVVNFGGEDERDLVGGPASGQQSKSVSREGRLKVKLLKPQNGDRILARESVLDDSPMQKSNRGMNDTMDKTQIATFKTSPFNNKQADDAIYEDNCQSTQVQQLKSGKAKKLNVDSQQNTITRVPHYDSQTKHSLHNSPRQDDYNASSADPKSNYGRHSNGGSGSGSVQRRIKIVKVLDSNRQATNSSQMSAGAASQGVGYQNLTVYSTIPGQTGKPIKIKRNLKMKHPTDTLQNGTQDSQINATQAPMIINKKVVTQAGTRDGSAHSQDKSFDVEEAQLGQNSQNQSVFRRKARGSNNVINVLENNNNRPQSVQDKLFSKNMVVGQGQIETLDEEEDERQFQDIAENLQRSSNHEYNFYNTAVNKHQKSADPSNKIKIQKNANPSFKRSAVNQNNTNNPPIANFQMSESIGAGSSKSRQVSNAVVRTHKAQQKSRGPQDDLFGHTTSGSGQHNNNASLLISDRLSGHLNRSGKVQFSHLANPGSKAQSTDRPQIIKKKLAMGMSRNSGHGAAASVRVQSQQQNYPIQDGKLLVKP